METGLYEAKQRCTLRMSAMGLTCRSREMDLVHEMRYLELDDEYGVRTQPIWSVPSASLIELN